LAKSGHAGQPQMASFRKSIADNNSKRYALKIKINLSKTHKMDQLLLQLAEGND
jgi:hypothetical protein